MNNSLNSIMKKYIGNPINYKKKYSARKSGGGGPINKSIMKLEMK